MTSRCGTLNLFVVALTADVSAPFVQCPSGTFNPIAHQVSVRPIKLAMRACIDRAIDAIPLLRFVRFCSNSAPNARLASTQNRSARPSAPSARYVLFPIPAFDRNRAQVAQLFLDVFAQPGRFQGETGSDNCAQCPSGELIFDIDITSLQATT
jgi:hypothetical protein